MAEGLSLKIPLRYDKSDGPYQLTKTLPETVKQNFTNLIMTVPGERIMNPDFGVGIIQYLFELSVSDNVYEILIDDIRSQTSKYLPIVQILSIASIVNSEGNQMLGIKISYNLDFLDIKDSLDLLLETY